MASGQSSGSGHSSGRAGRIRDEDVALVRERSPIAEIVGEHLQLRNAGGGRLKGLCPFHDEKTPSFYVTPEQGYFHCFGCGEGGDVISFIQKMDHLDFRETVEALAHRAGIELRVEQGNASPRAERGHRARLVAANVAARDFYAEQLASLPEAQVARAELAKRGFDREAAAQFHVGYAPKGWDVLVKHLRGQGFSYDELRAAGLVTDGQRGPVDRFRGRLIWPIADAAGDLIAFGARRLYDDDRQQAKYINTPETILYKKSQVLYGLDVAKKEIARRRQAVVVEGYTDVMACHLAGVPTAVATCGTAFGEEHIKLLRRYLMDQDEFRGEVIYTFDGDAAGQKAALRAFGDDQKFVSQTFVAVESSGMDPCELRVARGDVAVRDLVAKRVPLSEFAIRSVLARYDLDTAEGRTEARRAGMAIVREIRDVALRVDYARQLAGWLGLPDPNELVAEARGGVDEAARRGRNGSVPRQGGRLDRPDPRDVGLVVERETVKAALQRPALAGPVFDGLEREAFRSPAYAAVRDAVVAAGGCGSAAGGAVWVTAVRESTADETVRALVGELAVEPLQVEDDAVDRYVGELLVRLQEMALTRRTSDIKSKIQRMNPIEQAEDYNRLAGELFALEQYRRALRERVIGEL